MFNKIPSRPVLAGLNVNAEKDVDAAARVLGPVIYLFGFGNFSKITHVLHGWSSPGGRSVGTPLP